MKKVMQRFLAYRSAAEQMKKVKQRFLAYRSAVGQMRIFRTHRGRKHHSPRKNSLFMIKDIRKPSRSLRRQFH